MNKKPLYLFVAAKNPGDKYYRTALYCDGKLQMDGPAAFVEKNRMRLNFVQNFILLEVQAVLRRAEQFGNFPQTVAELPPSCKPYRHVNMEPAGDYAFDDFVNTFRSYNDELEYVKNHEPEGEASKEYILRLSKAIGKCREAALEKTGCLDAPL